MNRLKTATKNWFRDKALNVYKMWNWYTHLDPTTKGAVIGAAAALVGGFVAALASYLGAVRGAKIALKLARRNERLEAHRELLFIAYAVLGENDPRKLDVTSLWGDLIRARAGVRLVDINRADEAGILATTLIAYAEMASKNKLTLIENLGTEKGLLAAERTDSYARTVSSEVQGRMERLKIWRRGKTMTKLFTNSLEELHKKVASAESQPSENLKHDKS